MPVTFDATLTLVCFFLVYMYLPETPKWRDAIAAVEYTHFDEWWGPFVQRGYESMGDVMTRLSDEGRLVMSRQLLPFAEAKSCVDIECTFCPWYALLPSRACLCLCIAARVPFRPCARVA